MIDYLILLSMLLLCCLSPVAFLSFVMIVIRKIPRIRGDNIVSRNNYGGGRAGGRYGSSVKGGLLSKLKIDLPEIIEGAKDFEMRYLEQVVFLFTMVFIVFAGIVFYSLLSIDSGKWYGWGLLIVVVAIPIVVIRRSRESRTRRR